MKAPNTYLRLQFAGVTIDKFDKYYKLWYDKFLFQNSHICKVDNIDLSNEPLRMFYAPKDEHKEIDINRCELSKTYKNGVELSENIFIKEQIKFIKKYYDESNIHQSTALTHLLDEYLEYLERKTKPQEPETDTDQRKKQIQRLFDIVAPKYIKFESKDGFFNLYEYGFTDKRINLKCTIQDIQYIIKKSLDNSILHNPTEKDSDYFILKFFYDKKGNKIEDKTQVRNAYNKQFNEISSDYKPKKYDDLEAFFIK